MDQEFRVYLLFLFNCFVYLVTKYGYIHTTCFNFKNLWILVSFVHREEKLFL